MLDTIIIGGGPAGLQAALTVGRMHRTGLLVDSGEYRNATVEHAQNFITHDGRAPAEIRAMALADVAAYDTIEVRPGRVDRVEQADDGFVVTIDEERVAARTLVLATGVRDALPDVPGLADVWGVEAANCPFCHGHEFAGGRVGLLGMGDHAAMMAAMIAPIVAESVPLDLEDVVRVERVTGGLRVDRVDAEPLELTGIFVAASFAQAAPFAEQLGLTTLDSGCIEIDAFGRTSLPGVYAAGDLAHVRDLPMPMASVLGAAAAGLIAGAGVVRDQVMAVSG